MVLEKIIDFFSKIYNFIKWIVENHKEIANVLGIVSTIYFAAMCAWFMLRMTWCPHTEVACGVNIFTEFIYWLFGGLFLASDLAQYGFLGSVSALIVIFFWGNKFRK